MIGLPVLEAMTPGLRRAHAAGTPSPKRLVFFVFTGGTPERERPGSFRPSSTGADYALTPILQPLADLKRDILVISNLHNGIAKSGEGKYAAGPGGEHTRSANSILTAVNTEYCDLPNMVAGISIDQLAANALKAFTPGLPCLYLANPFQYDFGGHLMCWSGPTTRLYPVTQPSELFKEIFGARAVDPGTLQKQIAYKKSVLHHAKGDIDRLRGQLGKTDQATLDKYLAGVLSLEERLSASGSSATSTCAMGGAVPTDPPVMGEIDGKSVHQFNIDIPAHCRQMSDLMALAFQCDRTRVVVVHLITHPLRFSWLGAPYSQYTDWHDDIEHGGNGTHTGDDLNGRMDTYVRGCASMMEQFGYLVRKLKDTPEGDGTGSLLDNSMLVCTSEFALGSSHSPRQLPVVVAGGAGGASRGRHIAVDEQPISNLWVSMLNAVGIDTTSFGNSTGALSLG